MMSYCNNNNIFGSFSYNNVIGETFEDESFNSFGAGGTRHIHQRNDLVFEKVNSSIYCALEFDAKPGYSRSYQAAASIASSAACSWIRTRRTIGYQVVPACAAETHLDQSALQYQHQSQRDGAISLYPRHQRHLHQKVHLDFLLMHVPCSARSASDNISASERSLFNALVPIKSSKHVTHNDHILLWGT